MCVFRLRPHHALCMQFFKGKGYSQEFTDNMYRIIGMITPDSRIKITAGADDLCVCCPNLKGDNCADCEKATAFDNSVCAECGFAIGSTITAAEFFNTTRRKIILTGIMPDICGSCQWSGICLKASAADYAVLP